MRKLPSLLVLLITVASTSYAGVGLLATNVVGSYDTGFPITAPTYITANMSGKAIPSSKWFARPIYLNTQSTISAFPVCYESAISYFDSGSSGSMPFALGDRVQGDGSLYGVGGTWNSVTKPWVQANLFTGLNTMTYGGPTFKLDGYGDWNVRWEIAQGTSVEQIDIAAGSPFSFYTVTGSTGSPEIKSWNGGLFAVKDLNGNSILQGVGSNFVGDAIWITGNSPRGDIFVTNSWLITAPTGSTFSLTALNTVIITLNGGNYYSIALLPDNASLAQAQYFFNYAYYKVTNTTVVYSYDEANCLVNTSLTYQGVALRTGGNFQSKPLVTVWPHQYNALASGTKGSDYYKTMRGYLYVWTNGSINTVYTNFGVLDKFNEPTGATGYTRTNTISNLYHEQWVNPDGMTGDDTYGGGKGVWRMANMIEMADQTGNPYLTSYNGSNQYYAKDAWIQALYDTMTNWFTYYPGKLKMFHSYMTPTGGSGMGNLVGWFSSYGTVEGNDLALHYGYWISAFETLFKYRPSATNDLWWAAQMVINNILNTNRNGSDFPFMRNYDPFTGRMYASGFYNADNGQGNDLESSSEAMLAWSSIAKLGMLMGNKSLRDTGLLAYWTMKSAVDEYWMDIRHSNLPSALTNSRPNAVILRENAVEFNNYFGYKSQFFWGIESLPITPSMLYISLNTNWYNWWWNQYLSYYGANNYGTMTFYSTDWSSNRYTTRDTTMIQYNNGVYNDWVTHMGLMEALINPANALAHFKFDMRCGDSMGADGNGNYPFWSPDVGEYTWSYVQYMLQNFVWLGVPSTALKADQPSYGVFYKSGQTNLVAWNPSRTTNSTVNFKDHNGNIVYTANNIAPLQTVYIVNGSFISVSSTSSSSIASISSSSAIVSSSSIASSSYLSIASSSSVASSVSSSSAIVSSSSISSSVSSSTSSTGLAGNWITNGQFTNTAYWALIPNYYGSTATGSWVATNTAAITIASTTANPNALVLAQNVQWLPNTTYYFQFDAKADSTKTLYYAASISNTAGFFFDSSVSLTTSWQTFKYTWAGYTGDYSAYKLAFIFRTSLDTTKVYIRNVYAVTNTNQINSSSSVVSSSSSIASSSSSVVSSSTGSSSSVSSAIVKNGNFNGTNSWKFVLSGVGTGSWTAPNIASICITNADSGTSINLIQDNIGLSQNMSRTLTFYMWESNGNLPINPDVYIYGNGNTGARLQDSVINPNQTIQQFSIPVNTGAGSYTSYGIGFGLGGANNNRQVYISNVIIQ